MLVFLAQFRPFLSVLPSKSLSQKEVMLGYIHKCLEFQVKKLHNERDWFRILDKCGYPQNVAWDIKNNYDDSDTYKLFGAAVSVLSMSLEEVLEEFGVWFYHFAGGDGWGVLLNCLATNLYEFLESLNAMHFFINHTAFMSTNRGASFKCLYPIAKGVLREVAKQLFNLDVKIFVAEHTQERRSNIVTEHVIFVVESVKENTPLVHPKLLHLSNVKEVYTPLDMSFQCFASMFPTHICFNKQLGIEHCGNFLYHELELSKRRTTNCPTFSFSYNQMMFPLNATHLTFKGITTYLNSIYTFQVRQPLKRSAGSKQIPFALKGQMMLVNNGNYLLYMSSPYLTTARAMTETNLFLNDIQQHDNTRDLILFNQSRITQQELSNKVEEKEDKVQRMCEELDTNKARREQMQYGGLPPVILQQLHSHQPISSALYSESSCLQCDLCYFSAIKVHCSAGEVISLMASLFQSYDRLIAMYKINTPAVLRIGVHSGPVIAGLASRQPPRFTVLGSTVNITRRITYTLPPAKILVTSTTKIIAAKATENKFEFSSRGSLKMGNVKLGIFYLERNTKKTVFEIYLLGKSVFSRWIEYRPNNLDIKGTSVDGYKDLQSTINDSVQAYHHLDKNIVLQKSVLPFTMQPGKHNLIPQNEKIGQLREQWKKGHITKSSKNPDMNRSSVHNLPSNIDSTTCCIQ
uniref:guanylate cyclase n=2 Tax=Ditylenchus dipsaci TaxID=166011 RepID=A0A915DIJ7_9BILA